MLGWANMFPRGSTPKRGRGVRSRQRPRKHPPTFQGSLLDRKEYPCTAAQHDFLATCAGVEWKKCGLPRGVCFRCAPQRGGEHPPGEHPKEKLMHRAPMVSPPPPQRRPTNAWSNQHFRSDRIFWADLIYEGPGLGTELIEHRTARPTNAPVQTVFLEDFIVLWTRGGGGGAATRRNMRREERVTVQGPVKKQQPDGMSHRGYTLTLAWTTPSAEFIWTLRVRPLGQSYGFDVLCMRTLH